MISRLFVFLMVGFAICLPASAQFGPKKDTPQTPRERYAERAMSNALSFSGESEDLVVSEDDGINPERMQFWFDEVRGVYAELCSDRSGAKDLWARNCFRLGDMYRRGLGVQQDYSRASELFLDACQAGGNTDACLSQAHIDHSGNGGERNWTRAKTLYQTACNKNEPAGCAGLGNMLYRGQGGMANRREGARLLREACSGGYSWACDRMAAFGITETQSPF